MDTRQTNVFSYQPLDVILAAFFDSIERTNLQYSDLGRAQVEQMIRSHGGLDTLRNVVFRVGCFDERKQKLVGEIRIRSETGKSQDAEYDDDGEEDEDEDATMMGASQQNGPRNGGSGKHLGYLISFARIKGDPMAWKRKFYEVLKTLPAGLLAD
jgi:hypothetical protein